MARLGTRLAAFALIFGTLPAQQVAGSSTDIQVRLIAMLEDARKEHGFPGGCFAAVLPGDELVTASAGFADLAGKVPLTSSSVMLSGSIGKTYVAAVVLQLVAEESLDLDAKIAAYLGEETWFSRLPGGDRITLRMLLSHQSGIPEHVWRPEFHEAISDDPEKVWDPVELVAYVLDEQPRFPPGEGFAYADTNYVLVGMILERITGTSWYELLRERLLEPLELRDTHPSDRSDLPGLVNGFTSGTGFHEGATVTDGRYFANPQFEWCGGGVASTTADLARWCKHLFAGDVIPASLQEAHLSGGPENRRIRGRYGLGVIVSQTRHGTACGHSGIMPGYLSQMAYYPDLDLAVAIQFNTDNARQLGKGLGAWLDQAVDVVLDR